MNNKNYRLISILIILQLGITLPGISQIKAGEVLPLWNEGYLDIHHINTGKGESTFFILPDGTTMLVDAGATQRSKPRVTDARPNDSRTPAEWISRYIKFMMKPLPGKKLDYVLLTHFHSDHIGELFPGIKTSAKGGYKLTGISELAEHISINKIVDRGWPDYDWPSPPTNDYVQNYIQFVKWNADEEGMKMEQFNTGANNQFQLLNDPESFPDFEVRNIAANGHVWTGVGNNTRNYFPAVENLKKSEYPGENMVSCAFRMSYGKFDYFNGADITTGVPGSWRDIETLVGRVTGPIDVCLANHHAYYDAMGDEFLQATRPRVHIILSWSPSHPSLSTLKRMMSVDTYLGTRDIFATNIMEVTRIVIGSGIDKLKSQQGHIVIRVYPGGKIYMIYILDDSEENFRIEAIYGPYVCN